MDDYSGFGDDHEIASFIQFSEYKESLLLRYDICELIDVLEVSEEEILNRLDDYVIKLYREESGDEQ